MHENLQIHNMNLQLSVFPQHNNVVIPYPTQCTAKQSMEHDYMYLNAVKHLSWQNTTLKITSTNFFFFSCLAVRYTERPCR